MPDDRDLRSVLHDEAERHSPDRAAMLDRITRRRGTAPNRLMAFFRPVGPGPRRILTVARPVAAAVAVAGLLVAGVTGINVAARPPAPGPQAAASPPPIPTTPAPYSPAPSRSQTPFLSATGRLNPHSIESWGQSDLVLATTGTITALDVTVRIATTPDLRDTGHWTSVPDELITTSVTSSGRAVVYRFTLKPGATLAPGSYTFAAQYHHAPGTRPMTGDSYEVTATAGKKAHVEGGYTS